MAGTLEELSSQSSTMYAGTDALVDEALDKVPAEDVDVVQR